ncbi:MAG TPA: DNA repair protein RecN [Nitrospirales bacterium]
MLTELRIRNFAIIDEVGLEFSDGFTVLTGETGAGKSILVDALDLLIGGRASGDLVRTGAEEAEVSGVFDIAGNAPVIQLLSEHDLLGAGETDLIFRRILSRLGRHRLHVNGRPVTLGTVQALGGLLVDIHGQHDQQSLFKPAVQLQLLDAFGSLTKLQAQYATVFGNMREIETRLKERRQGAADLQSREELLRYQVSEVNAADPRPGEDRELQHERLLLSQGRRLAELVQQMYGPLYEDEGSILGALRGLEAPFKELTGIDTDLSADRERFATVVTELLDLAHRLRDYRDRLEFDPERLEKIEVRLDLLHRLMKKYGGSLEEVTRRQLEAEQQLREIETVEAELATLTAEATKVRQEAFQQADVLSRKRHKAAGDLEKQLEKELKALQMDRARVKITVESRGEDQAASLCATGIDDVQFLFSANAGEPLQPLTRIASGGELSRVMLAVKTVLGRVDPVPVLVFDEVDAGIGGAVAETVGKRLKQLSRQGHQVFCITHLAPIAAQAQSHFAVTKEAKGGRTITSVSRLNAGARVEEVARMLGGATITPKIRDTAQEMLAAGQK